MQLHFIPLEAVINRLHIVWAQLSASHWANWEDTRLLAGAWWVHSFVCSFVRACVRAPDEKLRKKVFKKRVDTHFSNGNGNWRLLPPPPLAPVTGNIKWPRTACERWWLPIKIYLCDRCNRQVRRGRVAVGGPIRRGIPLPCSGRFPPVWACPGAREWLFPLSVYLRAY